MENRFEKHQALLKSLDKAAKKLFTERRFLPAGKKANVDFLHRLESEWQDALEDYNAFFVSIVDNSENE